jgi:hypothetical protein
VNRTVDIPAVPDERLRVVEERIRELASHLEPLPDVREAAATVGGAALDAMLTRLRALTAAMSERADTPGWDAVDQLTARLMLQALAQIAVELRRHLHHASALLEDGRRDARDLQRAIAQLERELSPASPPERS